jgi:hypothetical protein
MILFEEVTVPLLSVVTRRQLESRRPASKVLVKPGSSRASLRDGGVGLSL